MRRGGLLCFTQSLRDASWWSSTPCGITMAAGGFRVCRDSRREHVEDSHSSPDRRCSTSAPLLARTRHMVTRHHVGLEVFLQAERGEESQLQWAPAISSLIDFLEILVLGTYMKQLSNSVTFLLSCFSHVRLCVTPETAAHQAPPSLGLSRQEHWSGLPLPSPMHESEKWKWSCSVVSDS